jgi:hypothetical protein
LVRPGAYSTVGYMKGRLLFLFTNIRLGCKDLPGTSTLLYYENFKITEVKVFIILNPGPCTVKLFTIVIIYFLLWLAF